MPLRRCTLALVLLTVLAAACSREPVRSSPIDAVVLIVVDTLRADRLSCYGYEGHVTAHMDSLAARGVRFTDAQAVASWTIPSMGALLTSQYPGQLGLVETPLHAPTPDYKRRPQVNSIPLYETTLAELLQEAGFTTAAFVNQPGLNVGKGFMQGFDQWFYPPSPVRVAVLDPAQELRYKPWSEFLELAARTDRALIEAMDEWLGGHTDEPVFVWLHLLTPHQPYNPDPEQGMPTREEDLSAFYDGEVRIVDAMIGDVVETIGKRLGWDRTLVVFTSDHGEAFGEHGTYEHGQSLHREVVHVPLMLAAPGVSGGQTVATRVRLLDIMPTILAATGVAHDAEVLQGTNLVPLLTAPGTDRKVFAEGMLYGETERSLIRDRHKLMYDAQADTYLLYDVAADPGEAQDLAGTEHRRAVHLLDDLEATHRLMAESRAHRVAVAAPGDTAVSAAERERMQEALKSLGY